jgi:hypothetical protein
MVYIAITDREDRERSRYLKNISLGPCDLCDGFFNHEEAWFECVTSSSSAPKKRSSWERGKADR